MSVQLIDEKEITNYVSAAIKEIIDNEKLSEQFCKIIQNRQLYSHCLDTSRFAIQIGIGLDGSINMVDMAKAGLLHDIGKIDIPIEILNKPGKLNDYEFKVMKTHSKLGYYRLSQTDVGSNIKDAALHHHEKLTGDGYPDNIMEIGTFAQIITVADIFSALTELRAYKKPMPSKEAIKILRGMAGVNQGYVEVLEKKIFLDELEDYKIRQLAAFYRGNLMKYGRIIPDDRDIVYMLGDEEVDVDSGVA